MSWDQSLTQLRVRGVSAGTEVPAAMAQPARSRAPRAAGRRGVKRGPPQPSLPLARRGESLQLERFYYNGSAVAPGGRLSRNMEASLHAGCGGPVSP